MIGKQGIETAANHLDGQGPINERCDRRRKTSRVGRGERETPGRDAVPHVLKGRIVVGINPKNQVFAKESCLEYVANVTAVEAEVVVGGSVGNLDSFSEVGEDLSSQPDVQPLRNLNAWILLRRACSAAYRSTTSRDWRTEGQTAGAKAPQSWRCPWLSGSSLR